MKKHRDCMLKYISFYIYICLFAVILCCLPAMAADSGKEQKTVRVGYVNVVNYEEGGEGEYKRGAGYEYLQKISYFTGWNYEYVYGSFKECLEMLAKGEIDLFGDVSYTPERAEFISFSSYPQGKGTYWLYTSNNRPDLTTGNIQNLNGCKIGVTAGSYQEGLLAAWLEENQIQAETVRCQGYEELMTQLDARELDAIAASDLSTTYHYQAIVSIGFNEYYFAVSKNRPDLLNELNFALYEIQNSESDYNSTLSARYYYKMTSGLTLNSEEQQWLNAHDNCIRLGYLADDLPFSGEEDGHLIGVLDTVMETLHKDFHVEVTTQAFHDIQQMKDALRTDQIDLAGPIIGDFYLAEQENFVMTDSVVKTTPVVVYKGGDYREGMKKIAATYESVFTPNTVRVLFPDAEVYLCDSQAECLNAVANGLAGSAIIPSARYNILKGNQLADSLSLAEMSESTEIVLLATKENRRAASITNKAISQSSDALNGMVLAQHSVAEQPVSVKAFIHDHAGIVVIFSLLIIALLILLLLTLYISRKKLARALLETRKANAAKTTFMSNMSHDIRTPLNGILGLLKINEEHSNDAQLVCENREKMKVAANHLLSLVNDVLQMSRLEDGTTVIAHEPFDLNDTIRDVETIMSGHAAEAGITVVHGTYELPEPYVYGSALHLRQIVMNIYGNCVKYNKVGGYIKTSVECLGIKDGIVTYRWTISDTGVGMSPEFLSHIFEPFAQEKQTARSKYQGTGLGMAIVKSLLDQLGGTIQVTSKEDVGSTFVITIPFEIAPKPEEPAEVESSIQRLKLLVVEDNELNAEIAKILLEDAGAVVTIVNDGQQALDLFREKPADTFDAILMDIMMPVMDGYAATKAIRALNRADAGTIPIIAMTANAFQEDEMKCLAAGMNAHLAKPLDMEKVKRTICSQIRKRNN